MIFRSQHDVKITFLFNIVISNQFVLSEYSGKLVECRHKESKTNLKKIKNYVFIDISKVIIFKIDESLKSIFKIKIIRISNR